ALTPRGETLHEAVTAHDFVAFLDKEQIGREDDFVKKVSDGLARSAVLVLVSSGETLQRAWVEEEWTNFVGGHGVRQPLLVLLDEVALPPILGNRHVLDGQPGERRADPDRRADGSAGRGSPRRRGGERPRERRHVLGPRPAPEPLGARLAVRTYGREVNRTRRPAP